MSCLGEIILWSVYIHDLDPSLHDNITKFYEFLLVNYKTWLDIYQVDIGRNHGHVMV